MEWFSQVERKAGLQTYEISVPSLPPAIVINDPSNVEHVFKCNDIFIKGEFFKARSRDLFGGLFHFGTLPGAFPGSAAELSAPASKGI